MLTDLFYFMDNYLQFHFADISTTDQEILIAQLADLGFEAFEQGNNFLNACVREQTLDVTMLEPLLEPYEQKLTRNIIEQKNWNEEWEKSFEPVIIDRFCAIRANFHLPVSEVRHEIIITPKMSFGTGHHATTFQVIQMMEHTNFSDKLVLDFGTGTGVLAILAEKLGARQVIAIDVDEWSINNAKENIEANGCSKISLQRSNEIVFGHGFDVILANINKHVILENLPAMAKHLQPGGVLILSGLLKGDHNEIADSALKQNLVVKSHSQKYDWIALKLTNVNSV